MIMHTRIEGSHLGGNLLGDSSERDLFVYLPPGYEESNRRYPTASVAQARLIQRACRGAQEPIGYWTTFPWSPRRALGRGAPPRSRQSSPVGRFAVHRTTCHRRYS